jgi:signal transduction histidine kinase
MHPLSFVTVVWSMIAAASLTLAAIYGLVWYRSRDRAPLWFFFSALSLTVFTFCELLMMRATTPEELLAATKWGHVALFFLLVSNTWFVAIYLRARRLWLAWVATGMRLVFVLFSFVAGQNLNFTEVPRVRQVQFLGEPVAVLVGVPNPVQLFGQLAVVLMLIFVADASIAAWRRGERRKALMIGGSVEFFMLAGLGTGIAVIWGQVEAPIVFALLYLALVAVMGFELSTDVLRASQLVQELREKQAGLEAGNRQITDLFGRLIAAQETERTRIARDLHDDVSQRIAGLSIMISSAKLTLRKQPGEAELLGALTTMQQSTTALADEIRHLSHDLHPALLRHAGLVASLSAFCTQFQKHNGIDVTYTADDETDRIEGDLALCLYRIAQEGLRNVAKHADARRISVALRSLTDAVHLSIVDDGRGFELAAGRGGGAGLGLISIDERARLLGGSVRIETHPGGGTRLHVEVPRPAPSPER